ncbi:uncharacterized protein METZ01_LOCUS464709 [marine metagenome]|uniref:Uncharacterized protein n=1 Tax=marine metagenome TaxID=408172 RepID=A0A383AXE3_9ZZZZ
MNIIILGLIAAACFYWAFHDSSKEAKELGRFWEVRTPKENLLYAVGIAIFLLFLMNFPSC